MTEDKLAEIDRMLQLMTGGSFLPHDRTYLLDLARRLHTEALALRQRAATLEAVAREAIDAIGPVMGFREGAFQAQLLARLAALALGTPGEEAPRE